MAKKVNTKSASTKLKDIDPKHVVQLRFKQEGTKGDTVVIEGFANKAVIDRGGDLIPPEAWELDNFKRNPIIFFNHDRNIPIGKATKVEATKEGLRIRVQLSKSNQAPIPFIRDMVKEGILKTFSVGFDPHDSFGKDENGVNVPSRAELLETSIVTLPMNQESDFELVKASDLINTKSYAEARQMVLKSMEDGPEDNEDEEEEEEKGESEKEANRTGQTGPGSGENQHLHTYSIDELGNGKTTDTSGEGPEHSHEIENGRVLGAGEDDHKHPDISYAKSESEEKEETFQECVNRKIPKLIEEGKERDQAIAIAIQMCSEKGCEVPTNKDEYREAMSSFVKTADEASGESVDEKQDDAPDAISGGGKDQDPTDFGNPQLDVAKAQLAMSGSLVRLMEQVLQEMRSLNSNIGAVIERGAVEAETEESEPEENEDGEEEDDSEDMKSIKSYLDRRQKIMDDFNKRLDNLS